LPVDIISASDFSQITKAARPRPRRRRQAIGRKVAEPKPPADNPAPKVVDNKPEIAAAADKPELPTPEPVKKVEPKPPTPQPAPKPPEPKQAYAKEPEPKIDPIAEAIKKEEKRSPTRSLKRKVETPKPEKKPEPPKAQPKFNASQIAAPARQARGAAPVGHRRDAEQQCPRSVWPPRMPRPCRRTKWMRYAPGCATAGPFRSASAEARDLVVTVRIQFNKDGSLSTDPTVMNHGSHPAFQTAPRARCAGCGAVRPTASCRR